MSTSTAKIRSAIIADLPSILKIQDSLLRESVIDAWVLALERNGQMSINDTPAHLERETYGVTLSAHTEGVARMVDSVVRALSETTGYDFKSDTDHLIAGALCHDIGKIYEYLPENQKRWTNHRISGSPAMRHSAYSAHVALEVGLPEDIVHCIAVHTEPPEGFRGRRSFHGTLVALCNDMYWRVLQAGYPFAELPFEQLRCNPKGKYPVALSEEVRTSVVKSLPVIQNLQSPLLRERVIDAWALALSCNGYSCIEDLPLKTDVGDAVVSDAQHTLGIVRMCFEVLDIVEETSGLCFHVDCDVLLATAICHDMGKAIEWRNKSLWSKSATICGSPAYRHTLYGAHLAMLTGLPEEVAHCCFTHTDALDSPTTRQSIGATIVTLLDHAYWKIFGAAMP